MAMIGKLLENFKVLSIAVNTKRVLSYTSSALMYQAINPPPPTHSRSRLELIELTMYFLHSALESAISVDGH